MRVLIVGAGLGGLALATSLKNSGHDVTIVEKRSRKCGAGSDQRSINLTLNRAGRETLGAYGFLDEVVAEGTWISHRSTFAAGGVHVEPYSELLLSIQRRSLEKILFAKALDAGLEVRFETSLIAFDKESKTTELRHGDRTETERFDLVIGADGAFSAVRRELLRGEPIDYAQTFHPTRYVAVDWSPRDVKEMNLDTRGLHIWNAPDAMLVAIPNQDRSLGALIVSTVPFTSATDQLTRLDPRLTDRLAVSDSSSGASFVQVQVSRWSWQDSLVLVGDACHAMYPFCGLGLNSALIDGLELTTQLRQAPDVWSALHQYEAKRRPLADQAVRSSRNQFDHLRGRHHSTLLALGGI